MKTPLLYLFVIALPMSAENSVDAGESSLPLLTEPRELYFADQFSPGKVSSRWFFSKDWSAENGVLHRAANGSDTTRIFLKDAQYRDVIIRFDFRLGQARDIRLVTGGGGHYNAVIHIHRDQFYIQTALDKTGPYFPFRHGECAYKFDPERWYTMTVEFIGDELVAHVDHDRLAYAKHPILNKERRYFAFQVGKSPASFDNVQIVTALKHRDQEKKRKHIEAVSGKYPVEKSLEEQFFIQKTNAHERLYQSDAVYRGLVQRVGELDEKNKQLYPGIFRSHKEFRKEIAALRKKLHEEDPQYKELLFATHRAARAIEALLIAQNPEVADLPASRRKREIEKLRSRFEDDDKYLKLVQDRDAAQQKLEDKYPKLFVSDEEITEQRKELRKACENDPAFRKLVDERAAAWRAQQAYLLTHDEKLAELQRRLDGK